MQCNNQLNSIAWKHCCSIALCPVACARTLMGIISRKHFNLLYYQNSYKIYELINGSMARRAKLCSDFGEKIHQVGFIVRLPHREHVHFFRCCCRCCTFYSCPLLSFIKLTFWPVDDWGYSEIFRDIIQGFDTQWHTNLNLTVRTSEWANERAKKKITRQNRE